MKFNFSTWRGSPRTWINGFPVLFIQYWKEITVWTTAVGIVSAWLF